MQKADDLVPDLTLAEMLSDPLVHAMMKSDGVTEKTIQDLFAQLKPRHMTKSGSETATAAS